MDTVTETEKATAMATFRCAECGQTFSSSRDDSEARAEFESLFGMPYDPAFVTVVCDGCYENMVSYDIPGH